jgi:hypothetical protein
MSTRLITEHGTLKQRVAILTRSRLNSYDIGERNRCAMTRCRTWLPLHGSVDYGEKDVQGRDADVVFRPLWAHRSVFLADAWMKRFGIRGSD